MFENIFKNTDNILWKDAGCSSELDYVEQSSWILFLKYLSDLEESKKIESKFSNKEYKFILKEEFTWQNWACPKKENGEIDHKKCLMGDDLIDFVNQKLFPYLRNFKKNNSETDSIEYSIGEIFNEIRNKVQDGYNLRGILDLVDKLKFQTQKEKHEMSYLYEEKIKNMGNAGRNGGEYYTPRPLIKTIIKAIKPKIGETIYDGAVGSAGFLCEAFLHLRNHNLSGKDLEFLEKKTLFGKEKKPIPYTLAIMNMILHGIESPNIIHTNTLSENILNISEKDKFNIVLANPPFGGKERSEIQENFPIKTSETAFLFLQHFIKKLKVNGRAGIIIKNTFLSNSDAKSLRKELLTSCNLHTILDMPAGTFHRKVKTIVLFFDKGISTKKIWYYRFNPDRSLGKTDPLNENDLKEFLELYNKKENSENSWTIDIKDIDENTYDLSVKNPNEKQEEELKMPEEIIKDIRKLEKENKEIIDEIEKII